MNLQTYCTDNGGTGVRGCLVLAQVAQRADCSADTLYMITKGHKQAGAKLAGAIEQATDGRVTRYELRPDVFGKSPNAPAEQAVTNPIAATAT